MKMCGNEIRISFPYGLWLLQLISGGLLAVRPVVLLHAVLTQIGKFSINDLLLGLDLLQALFFMGIPLLLLSRARYGHGLFRAQLVLSFFTWKFSLSGFFLSMKGWPAFAALLSNVALDIWRYRESRKESTGVKTQHNRVQTISTISVIVFGLLVYLIVFLRSYGEFFRWF